MISIMPDGDIRKDLQGYRRPALHFSGGKDSLACLYLLRDHLDLITVYHVNAGDQFPETAAVVDSVRSWIPNFVEVNSGVKLWREQFGYPSDLVPAKAHQIGVSYGMNDFTLTNRFDCCWHNLMRPMHERMIADGVDLVIRGTKLCDTGTVPANGKNEHYEIFLPINDWSHDQVFDYLESVGAPKNPIYDFFTSMSAPECMGCTAWWDDGKAAYLKARHPELLATYQGNLQTIASTISSHMADLYSELS